MTLPDCQLFHHWHYHFHHISHSLSTPNSGEWLSPPWQRWNRSSFFWKYLAPLLNFWIFCGFVTSFCTLPNREISNCSDKVFSPGHIQQPAIYPWMRETKSSRSQVSPHCRHNHLNIADVLLPRMRSSFRWSALSPGVLTNIADVLLAWLGHISLCTLSPHALTPRVDLNCFSNTLWIYQCAHTKYPEKHTKSTKTF